MIIRKTLQIAIIVFFSMNLFSAGAVADSGCRKECCTAVVKCDQDQITGTIEASMPHGCCSKTQDIPCDLKRGISHNILDANILDVRWKDNHSFIVISTNLYPSGNHTFNHFSQQFFMGMSTQSTPIYIQNLSLLC